MTITGGEPRVNATGARSVRVVRHWAAVTVSTIAVGCLVALVGSIDPELVRAQPAEATGGVLIPRENRVARVDAVSATEQPVPAEGSGLIADVATAPDGARFAISRMARRPDGALGRDIVVFPREGGAPELTIAHDSPRIFLGGPVFSADSQSILYDRQDPARPPAEARVEETDLANVSPRVVATNARAPAPSPSGQHVAFVRWGSTESLVLHSRTDGSESVLVAPRLFLAVAAPRYSPDASWIAFAAVGEAFSRRADLIGLGAGRYSSALSRPRQHGFPWEIWLIRPDGSELHKVTELGEDEPTVAWSPDGQTLAVYGGLGLTLVDPFGGQAPRQIGSGGFGTFGWLP